jgi:hypothetical protein
MKLIKNITWFFFLIVPVLVFLSVSFIFAAHAKSISNVNLVKFVDTRSKTTFMYPENSIVKYPNKKPNLDSPFLLNGLTMARIEWGNMIAKIDVFDVAFDYNHVDWLSAYAERLELPVFNVLTVTDSSNLRFGNLEYVAGKGTTESATAYLAIAGRRGYLISGQGPRSNPLVDTIVSSLNLLGESWGNTDKTQIVKFAGHDLDFRSDFTVKDVVKGKSISKVISNNASIGDSSLLIVLNTGTNRTHKDNLRRFKSKLSKLRLEATVVKEDRYEAIYDLVSQTGDRYVGFLTTTNSGSNVSLIVPSLHEDLNTWLSGKYYYIRTLQSLK